MTKTVALAMRNYAATIPEITDLLGSDDIWPSWIWEDSLMRTIENTSKCGIVIAQNGGWTTPNEHNTMAFPRVIVTIWADPTRDPVTKAMRRPDAKAKANEIHEAFKKVFHDASNTEHLWDGKRILGSKLLGEPEFTAVTDGNGIYSAQVFYGVTVG
jgi:hypothetical protein